MDNSARQNAISQWTETACGELDGDKDTAEYFLRVQSDRYRQQPWQHRYFEFEKFSGKRVLEIGVGQGTDLMQFAQAGAECYGVDITENHLNLTKTNFSVRGRRVELHKADATKLPFADNFFDCVYSFGVIHHIPEAQAVIAEIRRVLRPGGTSMVAFYYQWSAFYLLNKLARGLLTGALFRLGHAGVLATIEKGADGQKIKPYVKLYTKAGMRRLFTEFQVQDVSVHQLFLSHVIPARWCGSWTYRPLPLESVAGWYVTCKATK